jgi:ATP-binding cassette, subfamily B, bacterial
VIVICRDGTSPREKERGVPNHQPDMLSRLFPNRELFRGSALGACLWTVVATAALTGLLISAFLIIALLDSRGKVVLEPAEIAEFNSMFALEHDEPRSEPARSLALSDQGLRAVAWELRRHPMSVVLAGLTRQLELLQSTGSALGYLIATSLLFGFLQGAILARGRELATRAAAKSAAQLRESLHRHALRMGTSDLRNEGVDHVLQLFTVDVETARAWIAECVAVIFMSPLRLIVLIVMALVLDWKIAFEATVPLLACWWLIRREELRLHDYRRLHEDRASTEFKLLTEGVHRSRLVRGYQLDEFEKKRFERHLGRYADRRADVTRQERRSEWLCRMLNFVSLSLVFFLVGVHTLVPTSTAHHMSLAEGTLMLSCFFLSRAPLDALTTLFYRRPAASRAVDRVYRYLNTIPQVGQAVGARFLNPLEKAIEFEKVTYEIGRKPILKNLDLKIPAGGITAIVAFDPFQARALVSMLPRFVEPSDGKVSIDGEDLAWVTLESLRAETLMVSAANSWFTGTVLENIGAGDSHFSLSDITDAAKLAHAHNFIKTLPQGYETMIGEHGEQLDESQAFRLSLARAVLRDPAVLIVEEPIGEMTNDDKALLDDACRRTSAKRTVLVLPSRMQTLRNADRIVLLNQGRVEVVGTHDVLVKKSALYQHWEYIHFNEFRRTTGTLDGETS